MSAASEIKAHNTIESVLDEKGVEVKANKFLCPFHDDKNPSGSIYEEGTKWKCFAGCGSGDVIELLAKFADTTSDKLLKNYAKAANGNIRRELSKRPISNPRASKNEKLGPVLATYPYHDQDGKLVYEIRRHEPKDFRPFLPNAQAPGIGKIVRVPYRLPEILNAETVLIVEGEKDVDTLAALGIVATCNPFGAGKWDASWSEYFAGKDIILCGDNDDPGRRHVDQVEAALRPVAGSIKRVIVPKGKDISEYLDGMDKTQAKAAVEDLLKSAQSPEVVRQNSAQARPDLPKDYPTNDNGNARRFIDHAGDKIRFVPERDLWINWNRHHWQVDNDGALYRMADHHSTELLRKAADIADKDAQAGQARLAISLGKRCTIENMLALARYNEAVILHAEHLDSNPWLLGVRNGVVDLKTGGFRAGTMADFISNKTGCDYLPGATCPQFDSFLDRIMGSDAEMIGYLWRIIGYCLTGLTIEQCLFFFFGPGRNGKSTLIEVLAALFGDYGRATAVELITDSQQGREPSQLIAALHGKRLVWLPEVEDNHRVAQSRLKTLTGGDRLVGRNLYEREFEFNCTAKLLIHGNSRPEIRGTDLGIWRRFRLIPFAITIPVNEVDYDLAKKLIAELPGILHRAIEACLEWQRDGLKTPATVEMATQEYRDDEDVLGEFLEECTISSAMAQISKAQLRGAYVTFNEDRSQRPLSAKRFGSLMVQRGIKEHRTGSGRYWLGITLK